MNRPIIIWSRLDMSNWVWDLLEWSSRWLRMETGGMGSILPALLKLMKCLSSKQPDPVQSSERMRKKMRRKSKWCEIQNESKTRVCRGEHTGTGRGCRGPPQCSTVHEKTERRNKNRQHANSQQRRWQSEGIHSMVSWEGTAAVSAVSGVCCGEGRAGLERRQE